MTQFLLSALENILRVLEPTDPAKVSAADKQNRIATARVLATRAIAKERGESC